MKPRIGLAGAGGIGSNVAVNLVRAGYDKLFLVDCDSVEQSNLNRQFYFQDQIGYSKVDMLRKNLLGINPDADIKVLDRYLEEQDLISVFRQCPVVVEGFDGEKDKKKLLETLAGAHKKVVAASGIAGRGIGNIGVRHLGGCSVVGDFITDCRDDVLYFPKISIIAGMMADIVLKWIQKNYNVEEEGA